MSVADYNVSAALNTSISGIAIGPNAPRENIDDSIRQMMADIKSYSLEFGVKDYGTLASGATSGNSIEKTISGNASGTSDFRGNVFKVLAQGANSYSQVNVANIQSEMRHTAGTVTFSYGIQGFNRLGLAGSTTGNVTTSRGIEWHTANEGSGDISAAYNFLSGDVDLIDGTGDIDVMNGFFCQNQGHATRVTTRAVAFGCADFTSGAPISAAFYSEMGSGTGKYTLYSTGSAPSVHPGGLMIGGSTAGTEKLEVVGFVKAYNSGSPTAGSLHELASNNNDYVAHIRNSNASAPQGIRLRFTGASPNNTTQAALLFEDSTQTRAVMWSNGDWVNNNNSYGAISDATLKENIIDAPSFINNFRKRRFVSYNLIGQDDKLFGVVAQEEVDISPNLVSVNDDGKLSYNYAGLAVETAATVKELILIIDRLESRIKELED